jgi:hypothetical protein
MIKSCHLRDRLRAVNARGACTLGPTARAIPGVKHPGRSWSAPFCLLMFLVCLSARAQSTQPQPTTDEVEVLPPSPPGSKSRISDVALPQLDTKNFPQRPAPIVELGNPFFGTGKIKYAFTLPTREVITPTFIFYGTYRTVFQSFENPSPTSPKAAGEHSPTSEWANRLDIYGNLQLSGTERILVGFRPLDDGTFARPQLARYTGYNFNPTDGHEGWVDDAFNPRATTLFFEGDLGQMLPGLDPYDSKQLDIGVSVGRQPLNYQDGIFIDDDVDCIGITRNNIIPVASQNLQITGLYGWSQINRGDGINHDDPALLGLFFNLDAGTTTWNLDTAYVIGETGISKDRFGNDARHGSGFYAALSATRRIGEINTTFRALWSQAMESDPPIGSDPLSTDGNGSSAVNDGVLLFAETSWTVTASKDNIYADAYWGIDRFTSVARGPDRGGPLGRVGILFAEQPIGRYGSALDSSPERSVGAVVGYQKFLDAAQRRQLITEIGIRLPTDQSHDSEAAIGARFQQAFGQHFVLQFDAFGGYYEARGFGYGGRTEFRVEF